MYRFTVLNRNNTISTLTQMEQSTFYNKGVNVKY